MSLPKTNIAKRARESLNKNHYNSWNRRHFIFKHPFEFEPVDYSSLNHGHRPISDIGDGTLESFLKFLQIFAVLTFPRISNVVLLQAVLKKGEK
jgi:hypothetical protein